MSESFESDAPAFYRDAVVIDSLNVSNWDSPAVIESLQAGGITAFNATTATLENFTQTLDNIAAWLHRIERYQDVLMQVKSTADIGQAKQEGKVGVILGFQNATPIENHLDRLALFHALGVRVIQLTYNERNLLGNGCFERRDDGLSNFGVDAVAEMNRLGIVIDLSHVGERTTVEAIETSARPVAITHANAKAYYDTERNKTDEAITRCAEKGGVIGATSITTFLRKGPASTLADFVDAIDDLVARVGIDHVGVGNDFTQDQPDAFWKYILSQQGTKYPGKFVADPAIDYRKVQLYPPGLETPADMPNLAVALLERGYSQADAAKLLGGNWLRLFVDVWAS
ncbi:MAG: dipeptidase [Caldilineaceae bacterium]|nr:dipeptidase [Caldilineaceae bacterium]